MLPPWRDTMTLVNQFFADYGQYTYIIFYLILFLNP